MTNTITRIIAEVDDKCKHNWEFHKGGFWKDDRLICLKCGSFKTIS